MTSRARATGGRAKAAAGRSPCPLRGKVVVQCGGSGLLGRALTDALSAAGATLVVATRDRAALRRGRAVALEEADFTAESSIAALRDRVLARHGRIDGLVFNVVSRPMRALTDGLARWRRSMALNAAGYFATMRCIGDVMAEQGGGSVVNIASIQGMVGRNAWLYEGTPMTSPPDYFFHKGGMINLTRYLAAHYGPHQVRFNVVSPGGIFDPGRPQPASFVERYGRMTMLNRMARAPEIGGSVVFLLSDAASYVTGVNLPIDGGYTAK